MIKLGDFGLAVQLEHSCSKRNNVCGTSMYMAPEVYEEEACLKSDVWAFGMSVIEMAESKNPFAGMTSAKIVNQVLNKPSPSLSSSGWSSDLVDFVKKCLVKDVKKRASVDELLKHPFVKDSVERIRDKGNSSLLFQLAERIGNAVPATSELVSSPTVNVTPMSVAGAAPKSVNVVAMSVINQLRRLENELIVEEDEGIFYANDTTERIVVKSGVSNHPDICEWELSECRRLVELVVGDDCLQYVKGLSLIGFERLEKVEIGVRCFCKSASCFEVSECEKLRSVKMGDGCCVNWSSFVLKDCDSIQEVSIGDGCFVNCENTVFESLSC